ncbi:hypothetical protein ABV23_RS00085 [Escherichia coli]|nr:hypothetical protein [Escherichia coli]
MMEHFSTKDFVELHKILEEKYINEQYGRFELAPDIILKIQKDGMIRVVFEQKRGLDHDIFMLFDSNSPIYDAPSFDTSTIGSQSAVFHPGTTVVKIDGVDCNMRPVSLGEIDEVEFQNSTVNNYSAMFTYMCYLNSTCCKFLMYTSYANEDEVLHYVLKKLREL